MRSSGAGAPAQSLLNRIVGVSVAVQEDADARRRIESPDEQLEPPQDSFCDVDYSGRVR